MRSFDTLENWHEEFLKQVYLRTYCIAVLDSSHSIFYFYKLIHGRLVHIYANMNVIPETLR